MIYYYRELIEKYKTRHYINEALKKKDIYKLERGIYSNEKIVDPLIIYSKKYPKAIITMDSAFYYYDLTDVIPDKIYLATANNDHIINNAKIKQIFVNKEILECGKTIVRLDNEEVNIYDRERMLIELIRKRNQIPFDYYKELITNYRKIVNELDMYKIEEYLTFFKNEVNLADTIQREVF